MPQSLSEVAKILRLISEQTPYKIELLYGDEYQVLVENDDFYTRPDDGHDPFYGFVFSARIP